MTRNENTNRVTQIQKEIIIALSHDSMKYGDSKSRKTPCSCEASQRSNKRSEEELFISKLFKCEGKITYPSITKASITEVCSLQARKCSRDFSASVVVPKLIQEQLNHRYFHRS